MKYAYWAVICKTPDCNRTLLPYGGYIGPCEETDTSIMAAFVPPESSDLPGFVTWFNRGEPRPEKSLADYAITPCDRQAETTTGVGFAMGVCRALNSNLDQSLVAHGTNAGKSRRG